MQAVHRGEELYPGSEHPDCPDLVCQAAPGFDCKAKFDRSRLFGFYGRTGAHTREDAFFLDSAAEPAETVRQAGATVLEFFQPDKPQIIV
jgi:hypothetical protein